MAAADCSTASTVTGGQLGTDLNRDSPGRPRRGDQEPLAESRGASPAAGAAWAEASMAGQMRGESQR
jgi:hypothetical protein